MVCYEVMVLEYLYSYKPKLYDRLIREERLIGYVDDVVGEMHEVIDILKSQLSQMDVYAGASEERIEFEAESMAVRQVLPVDNMAFIGEGGRCQKA